MNTTRNLLYKKLFAISLTGMLLSSPASILAEQNQSPDLESEQTRAINPQNVVLLNHIRNIVRNGSTLVVNAITGGNPENNLGTVIPELQAAIEELQDSADDLEVAVAELQIEITNLDTEIDDLALVVADIPTLDEFNAAIEAIQGAGFDTDTDSLEAISDKVGDPLIGVTASTLTDILGNPGAGNTVVSLLGTVDGNVNDIETAVNTVNTNLGDPVNGSVASNVGDLTAGSGLYAQTAAIQGAGGADNSLTTLNTKLGLPAAGSVSADIALLGVTNVGLTASTGLYNLVGGPNSGGTGTKTGLSADIAGQGLSAHATAAALGLVATNVDQIETLVNTINDNLGVSGTASTVTVAGNIGILGDGVATMTGLYAETIGIKGSGFGAANSLVNLATATALGTVNTNVNDIESRLGTPTGVTTVAGNVGDLASVSGLYAQTADIQGSGGADNSLTTLAGALSLIEGTDFISDEDSLKAISNAVSDISGEFSGINTSIADMQGVGFDTNTDSLDAISTKIGNPLVAADTSTLALVIGNPNDAISQATSIVGVLNFIEGDAFATSTDSLEAISNKIGDPGVDSSVSTNIANVYSRIGLPVLSSISADIAAKATFVQAQDIKGTTFTSSLDSLEAISNKIGLPLLNNDTSTIAFIFAAMQKQAALTQVVAAASNPAITTIAVTDGNDAAFNAQIDILLPLLATAITTPNNANIVAVQTQIDAVPTLTGTALTTGYSIIAINAGINQLEATVDNWLTFYPAG